MSLSQWMALTPSSKRLNLDSIAPIDTPSSVEDRRWPQPYRDGRSAPAPGRADARAAASEWRAIGGAGVREPKTRRLRVGGGASR
jgi:hypothetical protein